MAEWDSVVVGGRADSAAKDGDAEHTFDLGKFGRGSGGNFEDQSRRVHNFCYNCRTVARIAPIKGINSSKDQVHLSPMSNKLDDRVKAKDLTYGSLTGCISHLKT